MKSKEVIDAGASQGISRRKLMYSLAVGATALGTNALPREAEAAAAEAATSKSSRSVETHDSIQKALSFDRSARGAVFHCVTTGGVDVDVSVMVCTPQIIRIQMCPDSELKGVKSLLEIKEDWSMSPFTLSQSDGNVVIDTGVVRFQVQLDPWKYALHDSRKEPVLQENVNDQDVIGDKRSLSIGFTTQDGKFRRSNETFFLAPGEHLYGLGEGFGRLDKVGQTSDGWLIDSFGTGTGSVYKYISFLMSTRGYGVFVNSTSRVRGNIGSQSFMSYTLTNDDPRLDLFLIYGPALKDVLSRYLEITGTPAFPPKGSFGIWLTCSVWDRPDIDGLEALAKKCRDLEIPIDMFHLGNLFTSRVPMTDQQQIDYTRAASQAMAKWGIKIGMYTAPMLGAGSEYDKDARAAGFALKRKDGTPYSALLELAFPEKFPDKDLKDSIEAVKRSDEWRAKILQATRAPCLLPDFTNPVAVKWWKDKIKARMQVGLYGIAMSDFGEDIPADAVYYNGRSGEEMHNLYSLLYRKFSYEAVAENSKHRGFINARSGIAGMQRFPICWSGDPNCTWQDMANTLRAGLSIGLSGVPFWSCDNGGFNSQRGHLTPELWIRWSQMSMFISHVRLNGVGKPERLPWSFGDVAVKNFSKYAKLRNSLLPYLYSHSYNACKTGLPIIRAMVLEFPDDPATYGLEDQYMFGDTFLVAPVCNEEGKRSVYLPKGTWYDYDTGKEIVGPTTLHIEPPLEQLPLYVKADSIIPMAASMPTVSDEAFGPITLDIRLSTHADFTLYDDDVDAGTQEIVTISASRQSGKTVLKLGASHRTYIAKLNGVDAPSRITLNGKKIPRVDTAAALRGAKTGWQYDAARIAYVKFDASERESTLTFYH
jgi:alpha-D-xyloside xylohydrolase